MRKVRTDIRRGEILNNKQTGGCYGEKQVSTSEFKEFYQGRVTPTLRTVAEAYGPRRNGGGKGEFDERSVCQSFRGKFLHHGGDPHTDLCKIDQKIHVIDIQHLTGLDVLLKEEMLQVVAGDISAFQKH